MSVFFAKIKAVSLVIALFLSVLFITGCDIFSDSTGVGQESNAALEAILANQWSSYTKNYPQLKGGLMLKVISPNETYFAAHNMPDGSGENSYFRAASITKTFTAAAILLLQQNQKLNIDDTLSANMPGRNEPYLPNTADFNIPDKQTVTIRQILEHRARIFDLSNSDIPATVAKPYANYNYIAYVLDSNPNYTLTIDELIKTVAENGLKYDIPLNEYHYSDTGYTILGKIIERVSKQTYEKYVTDNLLKPNGLNKSLLPYIGTDEMMPAPKVLGYNYFGGNSFDVPSGNMSWQVACGNLTTTAAELAQWGHLLYSGNAGIQKSHLNQMMNGKTVTASTSYGLGCHIIDGLGYGHTGATEGYLSFMFHDPNLKATFVLYANVLNWDDPASQQICLKETIIKVKEALFK
ncbi:MAG: serine hydrolase [Candidatus Riflebacteria bacterium]|nr:serine hydrolase [Candidatus Riflebacteria bacterium]